MRDAAPMQFDLIPSFLGAPIGDLEDLMPHHVAVIGYFCDNLDRPAPEQRYLARQLRYASRPGNEQTNTIDLGDLNVFPLERNKHLCAVTAQCAAILTTGARMTLVGGDASGLEALGIATQKVMGSDVAVVSVSDGVVDNLPKAHPIVLSVDLGALAGIWMSRPRRLGGLSPTQMIAQIDATQGDVIAAALFGLAPALDDRGRTETRAALAILHAVTERLAKGAC